MSEPLRMPSNMLDELNGLRPKTQAALLRIAQRVARGFEGEIQLVIAHGGVRSIRWVEFETGESIKEALG